MDLMFVDFVNSEWYDGLGNLEDRLLNPEWLDAFRVKWNLGDGRSARRRDLERFFSYRRLGGVEPSAAGHVAEADLRNLLRQVIDQVTSGRTVSPRLIDRINGYLKRAPVRYRVERGTQSFALVRDLLADDDDSLLAAVALSLAEFLAAGDVTRLKTCDNQGCRWVFYDESKNRSRRWCDGDLCGNLFKVRRYRERHRAAR